MDKGWGKGNTKERKENQRKEKKRKRGKDTCIQWRKTRAVCDPEGLEKISWLKKGPNNISNV